MNVKFSNRIQAEKAKLKRQKKTSSNETHVLDKEMRQHDLSLSARERAHAGLDERGLRGFKTWAIGEDGQPELVQVGDAVQKLGAEFIWSKNHWRSVSLKSFERVEGDGVADRALDFLALKAKADPLTTINGKAHNDGRKITAEAA